ncbi:hypothetical protein [Haloarcula nitratireducens]|uniref:Uncharacterized protein n=1 Tax=Haloarcula nitratireducens TaxID=2487749 RepID=A0AAW4PCZ4_9EURY|nr:hypothetical protein [Halomicroarcula nitratireducens]MBX0295597.1 hypothetical protein [Halomicroarcula nitratireducens]
MASAAGSLTEPRVLAHTKRRLFPADANDGYVVADTQFASERWLANESIDPAVKETLAPFNHVRVGSGYPDLVGVRALDDDLLAVDRLGDEPPLVAVEAKGYTDGGGVDVERVVVQAYDRLDEANAAYLAAPARAISQSARTLARELNVGVLGVDVDGGVDPFEVPRLVGNRTTTETDAIRFQASAQGVADKSFGLNHPKNYLAYPLAAYHPDETEHVLAERVVGAVDGARTGAAFLDLVDERPDRVRLTPLGREVVRFALSEYGSVDAALRVFEEWKRSRKRFSDLAPKWGMLTRRVVYAYPATQLLVEELQGLHGDGFAEPTLPQLVEYLHELHPSFTVELFVRGDEAVRSRLLDVDGELRRAELADGNVYHSPTVFQLKAMLYHAGILTARGAEPSNLDPETDVWALREPLG